ncbi:MAG TPA: YciI family protein [Candidatus Dormibacteraeota bacterium]|nr:YciI family protein [Candidatus Dormibacteraeota bacterium]
MKYVVFYQSAPDVVSKARLHFPAHRARFDDFHARGTLLMIGPFANPQEEGSMAVFTTREAAEEFVSGDPFVLNGVVSNWDIRGWNEVLTASPGQG